MDLDKSMSDSATAKKSNSLFMLCASWDDTISMMHKGTQNHSHGTPEQGLIFAIQSAPTKFVSFTTTGTYVEHLCNDRYWLQVMSANHCLPERCDLFSKYRSGPDMRSTHSAKPQLLLVQQGDENTEPCQQPLESPRTRARPLLLDLVIHYTQNVHQG